MPSTLRSILPAFLICSAFLHAQQIVLSYKPHLPTYTIADSARPYKWLGQGSEAKLIITNSAGKQIKPIKYAPEHKKDPLHGNKIIAGYHAVYEDAVEGGPIDPATGVEIMIDLPGESHMKNKGGSDGAGLCVYTSVNHAAYWQSVDELYDLQRWMTRYPGGSYPEKFDRSMQEKTRGKFRDYLNITGREQCRELCRRALASGRMVSTTYGYSDRYGEAVAHMVNLVHLSSGRACILDNNFPGENRYEWMSEDEFFRRQEMMGGPWVLVLLASPPPPSKIEVK
jgi:hypothetical protein